LSFPGHKSSVGKGMTLVLHICSTSAHLLGTIYLESNIWDKPSSAHQECEIFNAK